MNEKEFLTVITKELMKKFEEGTQIKIQEVRKNNNVLLQGLLIQKPKSNIAPTIYMDSFFELYKKGCPIEEVVERIVEVYHNGEVKENIDMEFFRDFEQVKNRIVYKLVNAESNKELLKDIPHILYLDLAICFYYAFHSQELGDGIILIRNTHMDMWKTDHEQLFRLAKVNTPKLFESVFITLDAAMQNLLVVEEDILSEGRMYVLTNRQKNQGAACILYPNMLEQVGRKLGGSFFVIPSSIHEVIILRDEGNEDVRMLQEIIGEANKSQVIEEEVLANHPYYYDVAIKKLVSKKVFEGTI